MLAEGPAQLAGSIGALGCYIGPSACKERRSQDDKPLNYRLGMKMLYARCSIASSAFFRSIPHRYPPMLPSSRTTRWHGIATATGFVAHARATARTAVGRPMPSATSLYDFVFPNGIDCKYAHTCR